MPVQKVTTFTGGVQNRLPAHRIEQNEVQNGTDVDFSFGDVRPDYQIGGDGGGKGYYYEAGDTWVSPQGLGNITHDTLTVSSDTTLSASSTGSGNDVSSGVTRYAYNVSNPLKIELNQTLTISKGTGGGSAGNPAHNGVALIINKLEQGLGQVSSYAEYNEDLYMGREKFELQVIASTNFPQIANAGGVGTITTNTSETVKCFIGDVVEGVGIPDETRIASINNGTGVITLDKAATATGNNVKITVNTIPIRVIDGDITNIYKVGIDKPEPNIEVSQPLADNSTRASESHSEKWYTTDYPIPFQYGVSIFDPATLAESPLSDLSDRDISQSVVSGTNTSSPLFINFNLTKQGKYAIYRTGGTSALLKRVCNFYDSGSSNITVSVTPNADSTNGKVTIVPSNLPTGAYFRIKWLAYGSKKYGTTNSAGSAVIQGVTNYTLTPGTITLYGFNTSNNSAAAVHYLDLVCEIKFKDSKKPKDVRDYMVRGVNISGTTVTSGDIIDFTKPRALINIEPFDDSGDPPANGKFIKEVNNFFFLAVGKRLHISNFAQPNSWPKDGYLDFEANITGLSDRGGEILVFTEYGLYRCYGNAANEFRKVRVGTVQGVPNNLHNCISKVRDATVYVSQSGICFFAGDKVEILTQPKLETFTPPSSEPLNNFSGVIDDQYYLLSNQVDGWKLDLRFGIQRLSRSTLRASSMHYRGLSDKLYTEAGYIGGGNINNLSFQTRDFDGGDISAEKFFSRVFVTGSNFSGKIKIHVDGEIIDTFNIQTEIPELNRSLYLTAARLANRLSVEFENCTGRISEIGVEFALAESYRNSRFDSVNIIYTGTPSIALKVDNVTKISTVIMNDPGTDKTGVSTLFFPSMTEGVIPHLIAQETEASRVVSFEYSAENI